MTQWVVGGAVHVARFRCPAAGAVHFRESRLLFSSTWCAVSYVRMKRWERGRRCCTAKVCDCTARAWSGPYSPLKGDQPARQDVWPPRRVTTMANGPFVGSTLLTARSIVCAPSLTGPACFSKLLPTAARAGAAVTADPCPTHSRFVGVPGQSLRCCSSGRQAFSDCSGSGRSLRRVQMQPDAQSWVGPAQCRCWGQRHRAGVHAAVPARGPCRLAGGGAQPCDATLCLHAPPHAPCMPKASTDRHHCTCTWVPAASPVARQCLVRRGGPSLLPLACPCLFQGGARHRSSKRRNHLAGPSTDPCYYGTSHPQLVNSSLAAGARLRHRCSPRHQLWPPLHPSPPPVSSMPQAPSLAAQ